MAALIDNKRVLLSRLGNAANTLSDYRQKIKQELEFLQNPALQITAEDCAALDAQFTAEQIAALIVTLEALDALLDTHAADIAAMRLL